MKKRNSIFVSVILLIVIFTSFSFVSAEEGCCVQTNNGEFCQLVSQSECQGNIFSGSCGAGVEDCMAGTCVYTSEGICKETPQVECVMGGGSWSNAAIEEVDQCKTGCCFVGDSTMYISEIDCDRQYTLGNFEDPIGDKWRGDLSLQECTEQGGSQEIGACLFPDDPAKDCKMYTKEQCISEGGSFTTKDWLCTRNSGGLALSDCVPTTNTQCYKEKVYFEDSCQNRANVYDAKKVNVQTYWDKIQDPSCAVNPNTADCGDCEFLSSTTCSEYKRGDSNMPANPNNLDHVCLNLDCADDYFYQTYGRQPLHGESWCVGTESTLYPIEIDLNTNELLEVGEVNGFNQRKELSNYSKYNLPGSQYYQQYCWNGEVKVQECDPFRGEVCKEGREPEAISVSPYDDLGEFGYRQAACYDNKYETCLTIDNQDGCESASLDCKWIYGYRLDMQKVTTRVDQNESYQGICMPLYSPGFEFWNPESQGENYCAQGGVFNTAIYQMGIFNNREEFDDKNLKETAGYCLENCEVIPYYGWEFYENPKGLEDFWKGGSLGGDLDTYHISNQKGYYCYKKGSDTESKAGSDPNKNKIDCFTDVGGVRVPFTEGSIKEFPIFFTHKQYLEYLQEKARSIGDCGYKPNFLGEGGSPLSEILTSNLVKVGQKMQFKENISNDIVYQGFSEEGFMGYKDPAI